MNDLVSIKFVAENSIFQDTFPSRICLFHYFFLKLVWTLIKLTVLTDLHWSWPSSHSISSWLEWLFIMLLHKICIFTFYHIFVQQTCSCLSPHLSSSCSNHVCCGKTIFPLMPLLSSLSWVLPPSWNWNGNTCVFWVCSEIYLSKLSLQTALKREPPKSEREMWFHRIVEGSSTGTTYVAHHEAREGSLA